MSAIFYVRQTLPWDQLPGESERLRKLMTIMLFLAFLIWLIVPLVKIPKIERAQEEAVPERLAKMVIQQKIQLPPPKPMAKVKEVRKEKPHETSVAKTAETRPRDVAQDTSKASSDEVKQARGKAESRGVLAFKDSFSDMIDDDDAAPVRLGADARVSTAGRQAVGGAGGRGAGGTRSLITSRGGSGGIANADVSRGYLGSGSGGGGGSGSGSGSGGSGSAITGGGVQVARAHSAVGAGMKEAARPLSKGGSPARTDEEIQIVFDKYKAALYRIYNRELRNDPSLRGKMVLALTIEPDGRVSSCKVQSTDMNSETLSADIVDRVLKFSFGAKDGVPTTKILYPIDFLPAG